MKQKNGMLRAIEPTTQRSTSGHIIWKCLCTNCNSITYIRASNFLDESIISCGCINSRGEAKISSILSNNDIEYHKHWRPKECTSSITGSMYEFDFHVFYKEKEYVIEYDGKQHFSFKSKGWNTQEKYIKTRFSDNEKNQWCKKNNIPIIRIPYTNYDDLTLEDLLLETSIFICK